MFIVTALSPYINKLQLLKTFKSNSSASLLEILADDAHFYSLLTKAKCCERFPWTLCVINVCVCVCVCVCVVCVSALCIDVSKLGSN
jgi:hypothetical protein